MRNSPHSKRFMDGFRSLCSKRHAHTVWSDVWEMFAISISNQSTREVYECDERLKDVWDSRESRYLSIADGYDRDELGTVSDMLASMVEEMELNPWQDFAGQKYMELEISNKGTGQFFTPYNVSRLTASLSGGDAIERVKRRGWFSAYDCACGGGAMLIATCQNASVRLEGVDWRNHVLLVGNDIDMTCVHMCYVQLSLIGAAGIVTQSNALTKASVSFYEEPENVWLTPTYLSDTWTLRRLFHGLDMDMCRTNG